MISFIYAYLPEILRKPFHLKLMELLKPAGLLVIEAFTPAQIGSKPVGPQDADLLYTMEVFLSGFKALIEIFGKETKVHLTERIYHSRDVQVLQLVAKKSNYSYHFLSFNHFSYCLFINITQPNHLGFL